MSLKKDFEDSIFVFTNLGFVVSMIDNGCNLDEVRRTDAFNKLYEFCVDNNLIASVEIKEGR